MAYAANTEVSVEKSRAELERTLARYGATHFGYMTSPQTTVVQFMCREKTVRFTLPLPDPNDERFTHCGKYKTRVRTDESARNEWEQECRRSWRALNLVVKAKLEAVESGITSYEKEFLAHFVMANGQTFGDFAIPQVEQSLISRTMPALLALPERSPPRKM